MPASPAAASISSGSSIRPPAIRRTRNARSSASLAAGAPRRVATTARQAGSVDEGREYGAGSIGIPYLRCSPGAPSASSFASRSSRVSTIIRVRHSSPSP